MISFGDGAKFGLVAPPAGAWIETHGSGEERGTLQAGYVAPPAGAWIETSTLK